MSITLMNGIQTFSGKFVNPANPDPNSICIEDIAHGLAHQCRFGGQCKFFYSVAQHSVMGAEWIRKWFASENNKGIDLAYCFLMHDSTEAYLVDVPRPIKALLPEYKVLEKKLGDVILSKFDVANTQEFTSETHHYDNRMLVTEKRDVVTPGHKWSLEDHYEPFPSNLFCISRGWTPEEAKERFLETYFDLVYARNESLGFPTGVSGGTSETFK